MALVRKGDTLWHIVKRNYGGSDTQIYEAVKAIEENNNIDHSDGKIFPGQKIKMLSGEQLEKIYPELIDYD
jgi:nucleoid-associated protein YgaU